MNKAKLLFNSLTWLFIGGAMIFFSLSLPALSVLTQSPGNQLSLISIPSGSDLYIFSGTLLVFGLVFILIFFNANRKRIKK